MMRNASKRLKLFHNPVLKKHGFSREPHSTALKGHGFSRAATEPENRGL